MKKIPAFFLQSGLLPTLVNQTIFFPRKDFFGVVIKSTFFFIFILALMNISLPCYAFDVEFNNKNGLILIKEETDVLVKAKYIGWARETTGRKWDGAKIKTDEGKAQGQQEQHFQLKFPRQNVSGEVHRRINTNKITYDYQLHFNDTLKNTFGGGIQFNLSLLSPRLQGKSQDPKLLPDHSGWSWEIAPGKVITVKLPPKTAVVFFERGKLSKIRVMFFQGDVTPGNKKVKLEVFLPDKTQVAGVLESSDQLSSTNWLINALSPEQSFIDLSYLNHKPAGKHGFVHAEGDRLVFKDGTEARFYGVNIQARTLFTPNKKLIKSHSKRMARLGINLVRLHHHDSAMWVRPSLIADGSTTQVLDEKALDTYFWWVKCLRDQGIYLWIDLQVSRPWRKGDNIPGWDTDMAAEAKRGMSVAKGFIYLNSRMQELTKKFNEELLTRVNPYTNLALKDDAAVMGVMITNENDLTNHFGNKFLKNKGYPYHRALFKDEITMFSEKHSLSSAALGKTWEIGPSKLLLNDLEARFYKKMIDHLRELGVKVPIAVNNLWGRNSLLSMPALTTGDVIDTHAYAKKDLLHKNPHYTPNIIHWIGQGQVSAMPVTVSEYNIDKKFVSDEGHIIAPYLAAIAAFQEWDAIMLFGYANNGFKKNKLSPWSSHNNPAIAGLIPAAAMIYRQGHVSKALETVVLKPDDNSLYYDKNSPRNSVALRTILERHRQEVAMPQSDVLTWLEPSKTTDRVSVVHDLKKDTLPESENYIISDTGELSRNWKKGIFTINAPKTQAAIGQIGKEIIKLEDVIFNISTSNSTVVLSSLDDRDLRHSKKILVSAVARVRSEKNKRKFNVNSEIVSGKIELFSDIRNLGLWPLLSDGTRGKIIPLQYTSQNSYVFDLPEESQSHWFLLGAND